MKQFILYIITIHLFVSCSRNPFDVDPPIFKISIDLFNTTEQEYDGAVFYAGYYKGDDFIKTDSLVISQKIHSISHSSAVMMGDLYLYTKIDERPAWRPKHDIADTEKLVIMFNLSDGCVLEVYKFEFSERHTKHYLDVSITVDGLINRMTNRIDPLWI